MMIVLRDARIPELVEAEICSSGMMICDVPALSCIANIGDIVDTEILDGVHVMTSLVSSAGWSNFGIIYREESREAATVALRKLENMGCVVASRKPVMANVAVPRSRLESARDILEENHAVGLWSAGVILDRAAA